jgi:hypothetical protein
MTATPTPTVATVATDEADVQRLTLFFSDEGHWACYGSPLSTAVEWVRVHGLRASDAMAWCAAGCYRPDIAEALKRAGLHPSEVMHLPTMDELRALGATRVQPHSRLGWHLAAGDVPLTKAIAVLARRP